MNGGKQRVFIDQKPRSICSCPSECISCSNSAGCFQLTPMYNTVWTLREKHKRSPEVTNDRRLAAILEYSEKVTQGTCPVLIYFSLNTSLLETEY